jgi:hypothetical protein
MYEYDVTLPDGTSYTVEHERDDLRSDQVQQLLALKLQSSTPRSQFSDIVSEAMPSGAVHKALTGLGAGHVEASTKLGSALRKALPKAVADTMRLPTPDDVETVRGASDASGWASAGDTMTTMGVTAVPMNTAVQAGQTAMQAIPKVPALARALTGAAAGGAAVGAATHPSSFSEGAVEGGIAGAAGEGIGRVFRRFASGLVRPSAEAKALMDEGIQPSIGQAADKSTMVGKMISNAESRLANTPVIGASQQAGRERPFNEFYRKIVEKAVPKGGTVPDFKGTPEQTVDQVAQQISGGYRQLFDKVKVKIDDKFRQGVIRELSDLRTTHNLAPAEAREIRQVFRTFAQRPRTAGGEVEPYDLIAMKADLEGIRTAEGSSKYLRDAARDMQDRITQWVGTHVPKGSKAEYLELNDKFATLERIKSAVKKAKGEFTPEQMADVLQRSPSATLKPLTDTAREVLDKSRSAALLGRGSLMPSGTNLVSAAASMGTSTRPVQKLLTGGYDAQQSASEGIRKMIPAIQQYLYQQSVLGE